MLSQRTLKYGPNFADGLAHINAMRKERSYSSFIYPWSCWESFACVHNLKKYQINMWIQKGVRKHSHQEKHLIGK